MTTRSLRTATSVSFAFLLLPGTAAAAAELKVLSAIAVQAVVEDLGMKFERATGHKLAITFNTLGRALKQIQDGETADVVILPAQGIDSLVKQGKAIAGDVRTICMSSVGVAVRKGVPKPDIASPEAFKRTMLAATLITIPDPARGGVSTPHILKVFERLGITEEMKRKTVYSTIAGATGIAEVVAKGEVEMALNLLYEFASVAALETVGPLPGDLGFTVVFSAVIMSGTKNVDAAKVMINFFRTPEAATVIKREGLEPAFP